MDFNYSYRAFVITCLLFGIMFLAFKSIKLSKYKVVKEERFDVEYTIEDELPEEDMASVSMRDKPIETNRAYNEAEKFISELENERLNHIEDQNSEKESLNENTDSNDDALEGLKKNTEKNKDAISNGDQNVEEATVAKVSKKNSTVSYRLVDRSALYLPNPVYTCDGFGQVFISIEVNATGRVIKTKYLASKSTTTNQCLIDNALAYAKEARFTTDGGKPKQWGSITYNFPGQQ